MTNTRLHPAAQAAAIDQQLAGFTRWRGDHNYGLEEHEHAVQEWEAFRLFHVPGIKFSDRPRYVVVPAVRQGSVVMFAPSLGGRELDEQRWDEVEPFLRKCGNGWYELEVAQIPEGWSYANIVPKHVHSIHDEPNPRLYDLHGQRKWQPWNDRSAGTWSEYLCSTFEARLALLYDTSARNDREAIVRARLQYHLEHGGNPRAFLEYVEALVERWQVTPPLISFGGIWNRQVKPVTNEHLLTRYMREWLAGARKAPNSAKVSGKAKSKRPDLKLLALVHALRYLSGESGAYISDENAQVLAEKAEAKAPSSGEQLQKHFARYALWEDRHAQRLGHGKPHTVQKRYTSAIAVLEDHPKAKAMAEAELKELPERE